MRVALTLRGICRNLVPGVLVFALLAPGLAHAADEELWLRAGVRYHATKRLHVDLDQNVRFTLGPSQTAYVAPDLSVSYEVWKRLRFSAGYRYIERRNPLDRFVTWHRVYADARGKFRLGDFRVTNRLRFQNEASSDFSAQDRTSLRDELLLGYKVNDNLEPYAGVELFYNFRGADGRGFQQYRLEAGLEYSIGSHEVQIEYRFENEVLDANDVSRNLIVFSYRFDI